jgi:hypothetical protein
MARRLLALALTASTFLMLGAGSAEATVFNTQYWDVSIEGKQTVKWSFAAFKAETCTSYYGSPSEEAEGSGSISVSFATKKKQRLWAETSIRGSKLKFSSFSTDGWKIPAVFTNKGKFSVTPGMPCGSKPGELPPLARIEDNSGCGTSNTTMYPYLAWQNGEFSLTGTLEGYGYDEDCPGPFAQEMWVEYDEHPDCLPKNTMSALGGTPLQEFTVGVSAREFLKGQAFDVTANERFQCEFPSRWEGEPPLKVLLQVKYDVTFQPTKRF